MTWQFNPYAIPLFLSAVPLAIIVYVAWRQRANLAARLFLGFSGAALGLVLAYAMELLSADLGSMLFWLRFEYLFHWGIVFWPLFAIAYGGYETWLTRRRMLAFFILPAVIIVLVWTNQWHGLIWRTTSVAMVGSLAMFDRAYGVGFWIWMAYLGSMFLVGNVVLMWTAVRSPKHFQGQLGWLVLGLFLPAGAIILTIAGLTPVPLLDLSPYGVALACIPVAISLFRFNLFDLLPAAYDLVIESIDDAVIICDAKFRIVQANSAAARLVGQAAPLLVGRSLAEVAAGIPDLNLEQQAFDAGRVHHEIAIQLGTERRHFDVRISPLRNQDSVVTGQVLVLREITDRKLAEQHAFDLAIERERVRVLESFMRDASHDFRTPISGILTASYVVDKLSENASAQLASLTQSSAVAEPEAFNESLREVAATVAKLRNKGQTTRAGAERLEKLVESILEVLELERAPQLALNPRDVNRLVDELVRNYGTVAAGKGQQLQFEPDGGLPPVRVNEWKLGYAMQKLMDNAIQFTPQDGAITVSTYQHAGEAIIQFHNTGMGIDADHLLRIFEPFYRVDQARSTTTGSVGMGLSIAKRIVEAHGGRIEVESTVEKGSTFRIFLPLNDDSPGDPPR